MPERSRANDAEEVQGSTVLGGRRGLLPENALAKASAMTRVLRDPTRSRSARASATVIKQLVRSQNLGICPLTFSSRWLHTCTLDILNLARTSKSLRSVMLAKTSRLAWMASLASVDTLPPCPGNMSEPLYAALLFDHYCFLCAGRARWVDYAIRLRLCKTCYEANIRKGLEIIEKGDSEIFSMLPLFPCESGSDYKRAEKFALPENPTPTSKYYAAQVNATVDKHTSLQREDHEAAAVGVKEMSVTVAATHLFAPAILAWVREKKMSKQLVNVNVMLDRRSKIMERLRELGYTEHDIPDHDDGWTRLIYQPKPPTDRIWNNIRPKLEEQLATEKQRRFKKPPLRGNADLNFQEVFDACIEARLDVIVEWYEEHLDKNLTGDRRDLMPNRCDARDLPSLDDLAMADVGWSSLSRRDFRACIEDIMLAANAYKTRAQRELADVLLSDESYADLEDVPPADILQGPYVYFTCVQGCNAVIDGCAYLTYEQLHAHWRDAHPDMPWLAAEEGHKGVGVPTLWPLSLLKAARFALDAVEIAFDMPRMVLDGWVREGRLYCDCAHPGMPAPNDMSWVKLLSHLLHHLHEFYERMNENGLGHDAIRTTSSSMATGSVRETAVASSSSLKAQRLPLRTTVDDACREQIEAKLAARPEPRAVAVCRICKGMARKTPLQVRRHLPYMWLTARAEEIVWHLRYCHGKEFEKRDILFVSL